MEKRALKYLFGLGRLFNKRKLNIRIEKDRKLLQRSNKLNLTQTTLLNNELVISITPEGYYFSKPLNGFAGLLREYKATFVVIILVITTLNGWLIAIAKQLYKTYTN